MTRHHPARLVSSEVIFFFGGGEPRSSSVKVLNASLQKYCTENILIASFPDFF